VFTHREDGVFEAEATGEFELFGERLGELIEHIAKLEGALQEDEGLISWLIALYQARPSNASPPTRFDQLAPTSSPRCGDTPTSEQVLSLSLEVLATTPARAEAALEHLRVHAPYMLEAHLLTQLASAEPVDKRLLTLKRLATLDTSHSKLHEQHTFLVEQLNSSLDHRARLAMDVMLATQDIRLVAPLTKFSDFASNSSPRVRRCAREVVEALQASVGGTSGDLELVEFSDSRGGIELTEDQAQPAHTTLTVNTSTDEGHSLS
jgi:hypothetical protein